MADTGTVRMVALSEAWLPRIRPWFADPEVRVRLGGPEWIDRELRLRTGPQGGTFRGRTVLRAGAWVALTDDGEPVGFVGAEVYDRWTTWRPPDEVTAAEPGPAAGLAYAVDPAHRRQGQGRRTLGAAVDHPSLADVRIFSLGIDADNAASIACAGAAGFTPDDPRPDFEDTVHFLLRR